ncbi:hypothetical protein JVT61DRAFT_6041 [Boletus reticuloceps]|uniref:Uncharacterized protein n=1 Tax=Boletus reticuloceps TaxID=495285 RepID=A0A8I2YMG6_9AGAM|nr:hypothetical protein JVT61DRAFT_6041 [Boletus reticuloceps]
MAGSTVCGTHALGWTWLISFYRDSTSDPDRASLSPRTDLLSPSPEFEDVDSRRIPRGPGVKFRRERQRAHSTASPRDLMDMLVNEEYESKQTRKVLYTAFDRLEHETRRAEGAEARIEETIQRARAINEARISAEQRTVRAQEELKLYKLQLDNAQKEILRAQDVLKAIEAQRDEAEAAAVSARSRARRLNEERMIELAREEGRRLGFEEGVRRGRRMGYRTYETAIDDRRDDVRDVAAEVVDRLLEAPDEPEQIEVLQQPTPIPPPSLPRTPPEVHRIETPINSSLENHRHSSHGGRDSSDTASRGTLRRAHDPVIPPAPSLTELRINPNGIPSIPTLNSQSSRPRSGFQPWGGPPTDPPFSRPTSTRNSPRRSEIHVLPDNYIPTADANHQISLPPPHELHRIIPSPTPSQQTLGQAPERGKGRDYMYDNYPPPRRGSPDDSLASGKQSSASTISQLDIVGLPPSARHRERSHGGLSVIHEDASNRSDRMSDYSQTVASTPQAGRDAFAGMRSSESLHRDRKAKQRLADELRYSDPSQAERWRQQSDGSRSQQPREGPSTRRLPSHVTVPTPLSPPRVQQPDARPRWSTSEHQGRPKTRSGPRDRRRPLSSDSSVPEINVEPPSRSPSDAPSRGLGNPPPNGLLSPDHAHRPLPVPAPSGTSGRSSPVIPNVPSYAVPPQANMAGQLYAIPSNGQVPPGFVPSPTVNGSSHGPVIPQNTGGGAPPQHHAGLYRSSSERSETGRGTPISFYAASTVPAGVTYPAPPISRSTTYHAHPYSQSAGSNLSATSEGRRRRDSLGATAGMTPASRTRPIQTTGSADSGGHDPRMSRRQSNASLGSQNSRPPYSRYDPTEYHDIAYLVSNDSVDSVTSANTAANGGGTVRIHGSPAYMYSTLRTNE